METIILKEELLPDMRNISEYFIFQQDNAPVHREKETVDLLSTETPAFTRPTLWPPNSPDLNSVDCKVWSVLQEQVYKMKVNDVDELRQGIQTVWDELDQSIISASLAIRIAERSSIVIEHSSSPSVRTCALWQNGWLDPDAVWGG